MCDNIKALLAKAWKNEAIEIAPGTHNIDEVLMVRVSGRVRKESDTLCSPTVSIPLILTLALYWEKSGVTRDRALQMLKESISEALNTGRATSEQIEARMRDVQKAVDAVKRDLLDQLPKQTRNGRLITKDLAVEILPVADEALIPAA